VRTGEKQEKIEKIENTFSLILDTLERIENPDKGEKVLQQFTNRKRWFDPTSRGKMPQILGYILLFKPIYGGFLLLVQCWCNQYLKMVYWR
jgi:hypothetical protein